MSSLDFPTDNFMYKGLTVPTLSHRLGGYQINAFTHFFFSFVSKCLLFWFSPKKSTGIKMFI